MRAKEMWGALTVVLIVLAFGVAALIALFQFTEPQWILSVFGIGGAIVTASYNYRAAKNKETNARLFADKRDVYVELVQTIMGLFHEQRDNPNPTPAQQVALIKKMQTLRTKLLVWGSAETVLALDQMGDLETGTVESAPARMTRWMSQLFAAIRKDLGHEDSANDSLELALGMIVPNDRAKVRAELRSVRR